MDKVTLELPGLRYPISVESQYIDDKEDEKSQESVAGNIIMGIIFLAITTLIIACRIALRNEKERIKKILIAINPYIKKLTKELHVLYLQYQEIVNFLSSSNYIKKLEKYYYKTIIEPIQKNKDLYINEADFVKKAMDNIAENISKFQKNKKEHNESVYLRLDTYTGTFYIDKVVSEIEKKNNIESYDDDFDKYWEEYFLYFFKISNEIKQNIKKKYKYMNYEVFLANDDLLFYWYLEIEYDISKQLFNEILNAAKDIK